MFGWAAVVTVPASVAVAAFPVVSASLSGMSTPDKL